MKWHVLDTGPATPERNMQIDQDLLDNLSPADKPILHIYDWIGDSATYGYFTDPYSHLNIDAVKKNGLQLAKRPTGGGIIFHSCDFAFSVLMPSNHANFSLNTLDNYAFVNAYVIETVRRFLGKIPTLLAEESSPLDQHCKHFCMAKPTKYDVIINGRKVGGGAQRRTKRGFLHQGSIALTMPHYLPEILHAQDSVFQAMQSQSFLLLGTQPTPSQFQEARHEIRSLLISSFTMP